MFQIHSHGNRALIGIQIKGVWRSLEWAKISQQIIRLSELAYNDEQFGAEISKGLARTIKKALKRGVL
jgi:hypothetical protein